MATGLRGPMSPTDGELVWEDGEEQESLRPFASFHPAVTLFYLVPMLLVAMFAAQPVYAAAGLGSALALSGVLKGWRKTFAGLRWQLPLVFLMAGANALVASYGATELLSFGPVHLKAESLAYGVQTGCILISVIVWCEDAAQLLPQDALMGMLGRKAPAVATMLAVAAQLVPQCMRRFGAVKDARLATTAAKSASTQEHLDILAGGILLSWMLEDSLERSDAMRARGWGSGRTRTSYERYEFHLRDALAAGGLSALGILNLALAAVATSQWHFYPTMPALVWWWGYIPYIAAGALPAVSCAVERMKWKEGK